MEELPGALFRQGRYVVAVTDQHLDSNNRIKDAYLVVNIETQVAEYETLFLWDALQWCIRCNTLVDKILNEQGNSLEWLDDGEDDEEEEDDDE